MIHRFQRMLIEWLYSEGMLRRFPALRRRLCRDAVPYAGVSLHEEDFWANFLAINGGTGAAKSLLHSIMLAHRIPRIRPGSGRRCLYYDYKNEHTRLIGGLEPTVPVHLFLPADYRSAPWDLAKDLRTPKRITAFWARGVRKAPGDSGNEWFLKTVRGIGAGVMLACAETCPGAWSLADIVRILESSHWTREKLRQCPQARSRLRYCLNAETWANIQGSIEAELEPMRLIAAYWLHAKGQPVSIDEFLGGESILLLGNDPGSDDVQFINDLFMTLLVEEALLRPDGTTGITDVIIDEATTLNGDKPSSFLRHGVQRGRSRGLNFTAIYQSRDDWEAIYGKFANGILGMFRNQICLGTGDLGTAKFNSEILGRERGKELNVSVTYGPQGASVTEQWQWFDRETVPYSEVLRNPPSTPATGIHGWATNPSLGAWQFHLPGDWVAKHAPRPHPEVPAFVPRPEWQQKLPPFTEADLARLRLTPEPDDEELPID